MACKPAARKGDPTVHGGTIVEGSPNVTIGGSPATHLLHFHSCPLPGHAGGPITQSSPTVFINGLGAARVMDAATCMAPPSGGGGGEGGKDEHGELQLKLEGGGDKKWGEGEGKNLREAANDARDKFGKKESEGFKPTLSGKAGKEWKADGALKTFGEGDNKVQLGSGEAKAFAGAGFEAESVRNVKANVGGKVEAEASAVKATGKLGDAKTGFGEVGGEAKLLTAKADAGVGGKLEVKNGKLEAAYAEAGAGAGASVVEGKVEGKTKAFRIPFTNWGVSLGGEASGALLTAEARASAHAGYQDGKWSFGFGAKLGALVAGLGFKFNISVEKLEPPKPAPKPPGVPGVAGIDPIAMGCFTVLIGDSPKPYVPGPPTKTPIPFTDVGGPKNTNRAGPKTPPPPGKPPTRQLSSDMDELYVAAEQAKPELTLAVGALAAATGAVVAVAVSIKDKVEAVREIAEKYGDDVSLAVDLLRGALSFKDMSSLDKAVFLAESSLAVAKKLDLVSDTLPTGFREVILDVVMSNGHVAELKLMVEQLVETKGGAAKALYDEVKAIQAFAELKNEPLSVEKAMRAVDLAKATRTLYDEAFARAGGS